jgi:hypothetical protein
MSTVASAELRIASGAGVCGALQGYGSTATLVGAGFFQAISTRNAGLQLLDFRRCNQAMHGDG